MHIFFPPEKTATEKQNKIKILYINPIIKILDESLTFSILSNTTNLNLLS